ncbi:beta-carotene 15,15'-monooxygenase [Anaerocolumna cellulosilytica]|uniref:Beta-carotene 15,15'-monooxygenase n=1 Tax=Anaerocolumna cellulosilytica TaxID=433286 RepID=A0A6S6RAA1_9FIRM|nr:YesL family protein [Anaerocolumna cellulosilytica]MBB5195336.1 putative membrane protein YesL [Anaerocolumna cellulosilytica]BCJ95868.1 beta-carotene 15,15'-monooxygenase [Anaerocolumna cellulosilytica]
MKSFFSMNSPLYNLLSKLTDILILSLLWLVCSLPIVTIGAATTAVYYVNMKLVKDEEDYIVKSFLKAFYENLKQGTIVWLLFLAFGVVLGTNYYQLFYKAEEVKLFFQGVTILATVLYVFSFIYAFPLLARYNNSVGRILLNSIAISIRYFFRTLIIIILIAALLFLGFYSTTTLFFVIVLGIGIVTFIVSAYVLKIFEQLEQLKGEWEDEHSNEASLKVQDFNE